MLIKWISLELNSQNHHQDKKDAADPLAPLESWEVLDPEEKQVCWSNVFIHDNIKIKDVLVLLVLMENGGPKVQMVLQVNPVLQVFQVPKEPPVILDQQELMDQMVHKENQDHKEKQEHLVNKVFQDQKVFKEFKENQEDMVLPEFKVHLVTLVLMDTAVQRSGKLLILHQKRECATNL